jgi:hypothetical protein
VSRATLSFTRLTSVSAGLAIGLFFAQTVFAQIAAVGPFAGDLLENFESFGTGYTADSFGVFGGAATHNRLSGNDPYIWPSGGWGLGSNGSAQASDGNQGFGINGNATGEFIFNTPITSFGAYFGTANSGDTMFLEFYDAGNTLIGSQQSWAYARPGDGVLEWHGYDIGQEAVRVVWGSLSRSGSAPAIDSIRVVSSSSVRVRPTAVPTLSAYGLLFTALGLLLVAGRRMRASA